MTTLRQSDVDFVSAQLVSETINRLGVSLQETMAGHKLLLKVSNQYINCSPLRTQGRIFEVIEATKFNEVAAKAGSTLRAVTTEQLGMPGHEADIFIRNGSGSILKQIQAKSSGKASALAWAVTHKKYDGMDRLVNFDHFDKTKELIGKRMVSKGIYAADYRNSYGSITGELKFDSIKSGGTSYEEAIRATNNPKTYVFKKNSTEILFGAKNAMVSGALSGAFVGAAASATGGAFKGEFCVKETGKGAANGAARQAVIGGVSYGIKYLAGSHPAVSANMVSALASSAVNMTELTYRYLKGTITTEEYIEGLGSNAVSIFSGIIMTAAGAALFGPVGAAVAGTVGLLGMKQLYKTFITAQKDLELAKEQRVKAEQLSEVLIEQIKEEEQLLVSYYREYSQTLKELKQLVEIAIHDDSFTEEAIVALANSLHIKFEYNTLSEFNDFMMSDEVLKL